MFHFFRKTIKHKVIGWGQYEGEIWRRGKCIHAWKDRNLVVNQGLNDILNCYLNNGAQQPTWFLGVFQGNYFPLNTNTAANIAAASTECSGYDSATRPQWQPAAPSGQSITNSANRAAFNFNATNTIFGAFLISNNVIGGSTGVLFSGAQFGASKGVVDGDQLLLTYNFTAASS